MANLSSLLPYLVCPETKGRLALSPNKTELWCKTSSLAYPIRDGIPVMLIAEARTLTADEQLLDCA